MLRQKWRIFAKKNFVAGHNKEKWINPVLNEKKSDTWLARIPFLWYFIPKSN